MFERSFLLYVEFSDSAQRSSLELKCQDFLLDYHMIVNLRWIFVACLLNSANSVFMSLPFFSQLWSHIFRGSPVDVGRSSTPLISWRENKGDRHLLFRLPNWSAATRCPLLSFFFLQLRNNCCWHYPLQSLLFKDRLALPELIRVLKYAKVSWTNLFNKQNFSKVPDLSNLLFLIDIVTNLPGRHLRYGSVRFPVEATRVFVIGLLLSLQLGVLYRSSLFGATLYKFFF